MFLSWLAVLAVDVLAQAQDSPVAAEQVECLLMLHKLLMGHRQ
jgi:hypothetical protein